MRIVFKNGLHKALTLSYDDGVVQDIRLSEIAKKYGLKITFNINSGLYFSEDKKREKFDGRMTRSEAIKLYTNSGNEVAVHAYTHPFLEQLKDNEVVMQIANDRRDIEKTYGTVTRGMAYPYGTYSDSVIEIMKNCGIVYSRTTKSTHNFGLPENWLKLNPTCHHNDPELMSLAEKFLEPYNRRGAQMFYLWGHSYEFDINDNWEVIENFAKLVGNRDDVWYATNIEIYDYIQAYNRLIVSFDSKMITNPSSVDVWADCDGEVVCIKAGETVRL